MLQEMREHDTGSYLLSMHDCPESILNREPRMTENQGIHRRYLRRHENDGVKWWGFANPKRLQEALIYGWDEGVERLSKVSFDGVTNTVNNKLNRRKKRADFGDELDISSLYSGELDTAWQTFEHVESPEKGNKCVTLMVNMSTTWKVRAEDAFWKGAAACILADHYTRSGYSVEIYSCSCVSDYNYGRSISPCLLNAVRIKEAYMPMDTARCLAAMSPGFLRYILFKNYVLVSDDYGKLVDPAYARQLEMPRGMAEDATGNNNVVVVPRSIESRESCEHFLNDTLKRRQK